LENFYHRPLAVFAVSALSCLLSHSALADFLIADKTYEGQAAQLSSMPTRFSATGTFKTSEKTVMCPESSHYQKTHDDQFTTHVDKIETTLRSKNDQYQQMGKQHLDFVSKTELCKTLSPGTSVDVAGAIMNMEGCLSAWMPTEYTRKYTSTTSFACFYYPLVSVDGVLHAVPSLHLIGFDEWASSEWQMHKL
jgi:hypothetical protein